MEGIANLIMSCYPKFEVHQHDLSRTLKNKPTNELLVGEGYLHLSADGRYYLPDEKAMHLLTEHGFLTNTLQFLEGSIRYKNKSKTKIAVEFVIERRNITVFGKAKGHNEGDMKQSFIECQKYDGGWRVIANSSFR
jgi:hypothetical protein